MRPLPQNKHKNGFEYILLIRTEKFAIYEQWYAQNVKYYEVFIVRIKPAVKFKGKDVPEREVFPADSDFGVTAWSYRNLQDAIRKLVELIRNMNATGHNK